MLFREIGIEGIFNSNDGKCDTEVRKNTEVALICGSSLGGLAAGSNGSSDPTGDEAKTAEEDVVRWLSTEEQERYRAFGVEKRRKQYLLGRIAAKIAIKRLLSRNPEILGIAFPRHIEGRETEVVILNDENGSPRIAGMPETLYVGAASKLWQSKKLNISISHSGDLAAAIAFAGGISCGIDIEEVNPTKIRALRRVLVPGEPFSENCIEHATENGFKNTFRSCREKGRSAEGKEEDEDEYEEGAVILTVAWSLKEALSKALNTGFTESFENFRIQEYYYLDSTGVYTAKYTYFPEYKGESRVMRTKAEETQTDITEQLINKFVISLAIKNLNENLITTIV